MIKVARKTARQLPMFYSAFKLQPEGKVITHFPSLAMVTPEIEMTQLLLSIWLKSSLHLLKVYDHISTIGLDITDWHPFSLTQVYFLLKGRLQKLLYN
jgi:hypothetical protein